MVVYKYLLLLILFASRVFVLNWFLILWMSALTHEGWKAELLLQSYWLTPLGQYLWALSKKKLCLAQTWWNILLLWGHQAPFRRTEQLYDKFGFPHREGIMSLKSSPGGQSFSFNTIGLPSGSCSRSVFKETSVSSLLEQWGKNKTPVFLCMSTKQCQKK